MNVISYLLQFTHSVTLTPTHYVPLALFHISSADKELQLEASFDLEDFSTSSSLTTNAIDLATLQAYLDEHLQFEFDTQLTRSEISTFEIVQNHLKLKASFGAIERPLNSIKIKNNCLNDIYNHSNIIQLDLNNSSKDFRMHRRRTEITVDY